MDIVTLTAFADELEKIAISKEYVENLGESGLIHRGGSAMIYAHRGSDPDRAMTHTRKGNLRGSALEGVKRRKGALSDRLKEKAKGLESAGAKAEKAVLNLGEEGDLHRGLGRLAERRGQLAAERKKLVERSASQKPKPPPAPAPKTQPPPAAASSTPKPPPSSPSTPKPTQATSSTSSSSARSGSSGGGSSASGKSSRKMPKAGPGLKLKPGARKALALGGLGAAGLAGYAGYRLLKKKKD